MACMATVGDLLRRGGAAVSSLYGAANLTNNGLIEGGGAVGGLNKYYGLEVGAGVTGGRRLSVLNHGTIMGGAGPFFSGPWRGQQRRRRGFQAPSSRAIRA